MRKNLVVKKNKTMGVEEERRRILFLLFNYLKCKNKVKRNTVLKDKSMPVHAHYTRDNANIFPQE